MLYLIQMEKLSVKLKASKNASMGKNRFAEFAYKPARVNNIPFGLETTTSNILSEILALDGSLTQSVAGLMAQAKASGTMENYERTTRRFADFCGSKGYSYPEFGEKAVLHFVIQLDNDKVSMATLCQVKPALQLVEKLSGRPDSAWTDLVDIFMVAAKRRAASMKPAVKKAGILPPDTLHRLHEVCFIPHVENELAADPVLLRTYVRSVVIYFTFCRFNCYSKLRAQDLEDKGSSIQITFKSAKNDQFHDGKITYLVENESPVNPVRIVRSYFRICGFSFGRESGDVSLLNCVIRRKRTGWTADGRRGIGYTTATKNTREMLAKVGIFSDRATDKSFKMLGVTKTMDQGTALEDVMQQGRWRTVSMPLHYKVNSDQFKERIASNVPA
jgi:hypothetical protein